MTREEAIQAARARVEIEAHKPGRYRFGPLRWMVRVYQHWEEHTLYGPTAIGRVDVSDRGGWVVRAYAYQRGLRELHTWTWRGGEYKFKSVAPRASVARPFGKRRGVPKSPSQKSRCPRLRRIHGRERMTKVEAIQAAKQTVEYRSGSGRRWVVGYPPDSYDDPAYRVEIHILEGSPVKGAVVAWGRLDGGVAIAYSVTLKKLRAFSWQQ